MSQATAMRTAAEAEAASMLAVAREEAARVAAETKAALAFVQAERQSATVAVSEQVKVVNQQGSEAHGLKELSPDEKAFALFLKQRGLEMILAALRSKFGVCTLEDFEHLHAYDVHCLSLTAAQRHGFIQALATVQPAKAQETTQSSQDNAPLRLSVFRNSTRTAPFRQRDIARSTKSRPRAKQAETVTRQQGIVSSDAVSRRRQHTNTAKPYRATKSVAPCRRALSPGLFDRLHKDGAIFEARKQQKREECRQQRAAAERRHLENMRQGPTVSKGTAELTDKAKKAQGLSPSARATKQIEQARAQRLANEEVQLKKAAARAAGVRLNVTPTKLSAEQLIESMAKLAQPLVRIARKPEDREPVLQKSSRASLEALGKLATPNKYKVVQPATTPSASASSEASSRCRTGLSVPRCYPAPGSPPQLSTPARRTYGELREATQQKAVRPGAQYKCQSPPRPTMVSTNTAHLIEYTCAWIGKNPQHEATIKVAKRADPRYRFMLDEACDVDAGYFHQRRSYELSRPKNSQTKTETIAKLSAVNKPTCKLQMLMDAVVQPLAPPPLSPTTKMTKSTSKSQKTMRIEKQSAPATLPDEGGSPNSKAAKAVEAAVAAEEALRQRAEAAKAEAEAAKAEADAARLVFEQAELQALGVTRDAESRVEQTQRNWSADTTLDELLSQETSYLSQHIGTRLPAAKLKFVRSALGQREAQQRLVNQACTILSCEGASIFLLDVNTNELVVHGSVGAAGVRIARNVGVAGQSLSRGEHIVIDDAYNDSRFDSSTDQATGHVTSSLLSVPIRDGNCTVVGVLQAVNKLNSVKFDLDDALMAQELAMLAGVTLTYSVSLQTGDQQDFVQLVTDDDHEYLSPLTDATTQNAVDEQYLIVTCPHDVSAGQLLYVTTPLGREIELVVPDGIVPGDEIEVMVDKLSQVDSGPEIETEEDKAEAEAEAEAARIAAQEQLGLSLQTTPVDAPRPARPPKPAKPQSPQPSNETKPQLPDKVFTNARHGKRPCTVVVGSTGLKILEEGEGAAAGTGTNSFSFEEMLEWKAVNGRGKNSNVQVLYKRIDSQISDVVGIRLQQPAMLVTALDIANSLRKTAATPPAPTGVKAEQEQEQGILDISAEPSHRDEGDGLAPSPELEAVIDCHGGRGRCSVSVRSGGIEMADDTENVETSVPTDSVSEEGIELSVVCPDGVSAGQLLSVTAPDGREIEVKIPAGIAPGDEFEMILDTQEGNGDESELVGSQLEMLLDGGEEAAGSSNGDEDVAESMAALEATARQQAKTNAKAAADAAAVLSAWACEWCSVGGVDVGSSMMPGPSGNQSLCAACHAAFSVQEAEADAAEIARADVVARVEAAATAAEEVRQVAAEDQREAQRRQLEALQVAAAVELDAALGSLHDDDDDLAAGMVELSRLAELGRQGESSDPPPIPQSAQADGTDLDGNESSPFAALEAELATSDEDGDDGGDSGAVAAAAAAAAVPGGFKTRQKEAAATDNVMNDAVFGELFDMLDDTTSAPSTLADSDLMSMLESSGDESS
jgi:hypothetical protein